MQAYQVNKFSLGELSPRLLGHPDSEIYYNGSRELKNVYVTEQSGAAIVPGTYHERSTVDNLPARIEPYKYEDSGFTILFSDELIEIIGEAVDPIETPWTQDEIEDLDMAQYGDSLYIVHAEHPIHNLSRSPAGVWSLNVVSIGTFNAEGDYPSTITTYEGRLVVGATNNSPRRRWGSMAGFPEEFDSEDVNDDSPWNAEGPHKIYWLRGGRALFIGTSDGVYRVGGPDQITTPANAFVEHQISSYSVGKAKPVLAGTYLLVPQKTSSALRAVVYENDSQGYVSPNVAVYSEHLFAAGIKRMVFQREPEPTTWVATNDGRIVTVRINERDQFPAITEIVPRGFCEDICALPTGGEDEIRFIVRRFIDGVWRRHIDLMAPFNQGPELENMHFFFSGVSWDGGDPFEVVAATNSDPCVVTVEGHDFQVGDNIRIRRSKSVEQLNGVFTCGNIDGDEITLRDSTDTDFIDSSQWSEFVLIHETNTVCELVRNSIDGLLHLNGEELGALIDGEAVEDVVPQGHTAYLQNFGNKIHAGYLYRARIRLMPIGMEPNRVKRVSRIFFRFIETIGARYGEIDDDGRETVSATLPFRRFEDIMGEPIELFSGVKDVEIEGDYLRNGAPFVESGGPLPFMVTNIMCELEVW